MSSTADLRIKQDGNAACVRSILQTIRFNNNKVKRESQKFKDDLASCRSPRQEGKDDESE